MGSDYAAGIRAFGSFFARLPNAFLKYLIVNRKSEGYDVIRTCFRDVGSLEGKMVKKALPVGVENFEDIVISNYYYVDKKYS